MSSRKSPKSSVFRGHTPQSVSPEVVELLERLERDLVTGGVSLETTAGSLRERLVQSTALYGEVVEALVANATEWSAPLLNLLLQDARGKDERKQVKRALYRLRQKGFVCEEPELKEKSIWKPPPAPKPYGMLSWIYLEGERILLMGLPVEFSKSVLMDAVVSDREGLRQYRSGVFPGRKLPRILEEMGKSNQDDFIEADPAYCRLMLEEARDISLRKGKELPSNFIEDMENMTRRVPKMEIHPLYQRLDLDKEQVRNSPFSREEVIKLLEAKTTPIPIIDLSILAPYFQEYTTATESRIVLSDFQQTARKEEIYRRAVADIFGRAEEKHVVRRRLEEVGYFMLVKGFEKEARAFAAAATEVETAQPGEMLTPNSLLMTLVHHSLEVHTKMQLKKEEEEKPSLIHRPWSTLIDEGFDLKDD